MQQMKHRKTIRHHNELGFLHMEDGPAVIHFNTMNGNLYREAWYQNDERHRDDGPAVVVYHEDGTVGITRYYKHGRQLPSEAFIGIEPETPEFKFQWEMM